MALLFDINIHGYVYCLSSGVCHIFILALFHCAQIETWARLFKANDVVNVSLKF